mgnify:FL=1
MKNVTIINGTCTTGANARRIAREYVAANFETVENFTNCGYKEIEVSKPSPNAELRIFAR